MQLQDDYNRSVESNNQYWKDYGAHLNKTLRESKPESVAAFLESGGDGSLLEYNEARLTYNLPDIGPTKRAKLELNDILPNLSADSFNLMIDEYIANNEDGLNDELEKHKRKTLEFAKASSVGSIKEGIPSKDVNEQEVLANAEEWFMSQRREKAARMIVSNAAKSLADEQTLSNPLALTKYETQVYDDLMRDPSMESISEEMGFGRSFQLISIDENPNFIGEYVAEEADQINALNNIGVPRAQVALDGTVKFISSVLDSYAVGLSYAGGGPEATRSAAIDVGINIDERYREYLSFKSEIDEKVKRARESLNTYGFTRDQVNTLGTMSVYDAEDLAGRSADAIADAYDAARDAQTALGGLSSSIDYRKALESTPTSLVYMLPQAALTSFGPAGAVAGVFITTAGMGSGVGMEKYAELDTDVRYAGLSSHEKLGVAMAHGFSEGGGEAFGNLVFAKLPGILKGGSRITSSMIVADPIYKRFARILGGFAIGSQASGAEEYISEMTTESLQIIADSYADDVASGKATGLAEWHQNMQNKGGYYKLLQDNSERIFEAGRIGYGMGVTFGGGTTAASYLATEFERVARPKNFKYRQFINSVADQSIFDGVTEKERAEIEADMRKYLSMSLTEKTSSQGVQLSEKIKSHFGKISGPSKRTAEGLLGLANSSPDALFEAYVTDMQARNLERAGGNYTQDENGRWRLNGRYISDPTNTELYKLNQTLSKEERAKYMQDYKISRSRIRQAVNRGVWISGLTFDTNPALKRITGRKTQFPRGADAIVIDKESDVSKLFKTEEEIKMYQAFQSRLKEGESIVVHSGQYVNETDSLGNYVEYEDGRKEIHVGNDLNEVGYVLAHEHGHLFTEEYLQDPNKRDELFNNVINELGSASNSLAVALFEKYFPGRDFGPSVVVGKSGRVLAVGSNWLTEAYGVLSQEEKAVFQREFIINYLDSMARGSISLSDGMVICFKTLALK
jgi:hypothetical protein